MRLRVCASTRRYSSSMPTVNAGSCMADAWSWPNVVTDCRDRLSVRSCAYSSAIERHPCVNGAAPRVRRERGGFRCRAHLTPTCRDCRTRRRRRSPADTATPVPVSAGAAARAVERVTRTVPMEYWLQCSLRVQPGAGYEHCTDGFRSAQTSRADAAGIAPGADRFGSASSLRADAARNPFADRIRPRSRAGGTACSSARAGSSAGSGASRSAGAARCPRTGCAGGRRRRWRRHCPMAQAVVRRLIRRRRPSFGAVGPRTSQTRISNPATEVASASRIRRRSLEARSRWFRLPVRPARPPPSSRRPEHPHRRRRTTRPAHTSCRRTSGRRFRRAEPR